MHHRSSTAALLSVIHDWLCALDSGKEVCVVFFDVRKAFDSVPHIPLLQKLEDTGLYHFYFDGLETKETENNLQLLMGAPEDYVSLQIGIDEISSCLKSKHLDMNPSKCCHLLLTRKRSLSIAPPALMLSGVSLKRVYEYKYLGVQITSDLMWSSHITNICNKT